MMGNSHSELFEKNLQVLETLTSPTPISIDDEFWLGFIKKLRLPDECFEEYYDGATNLNSVVKKYFLRLMITNESSANFATFLRYFTAFLTAYRTADADSCPCAPIDLLALCILCRTLLKQWCESFDAYDLLYHFELVASSATVSSFSNHSSAKDTKDTEATFSSGSFSVLYRGQRHIIPRCEVDISVRDQIVDLVRQNFPDEEKLFSENNFLLRGADGNVTTCREVQNVVRSRQQQEYRLEFRLLPLRVSRTSTVSALLVEICEFCVSTTEGSILGSSTPLEVDEEGDPKRINHVSNSMVQVHTTLVEILILLCSVIQPKDTDIVERRNVSSYSDHDTMLLAPFYYTFVSSSDQHQVQRLFFLEGLLDSLDEDLSINFVTFLSNSIAKMGIVGQPSIVPTVARHGYRSLTFLMLVVHYQRSSCAEQNCNQNNIFAECIGKVIDPRLCQHNVKSTMRLLGTSYESLLQAILNRLSEHMFCFLLYVFIYRNKSFRLYCLSRTDQEEVFEPILILLYRVPIICENLQLDTIPPPCLILVIVLLILSKDRAVIASTSKIKLTEVPWFPNRSLTDISLSSLWVLVLLRLLQWNFKNYKDEFFVSILSGIFSNMATNSIEDIHWHVAQRLVDVTNMLAKTTIQISREDGPSPSDRALPYRLLLATLLQLQWSLIQNGKMASKNATLVFTLMRRIPGDLDSLPQHLPEKSLPSRCVMALKEVVEYFDKSLDFENEEDDAYSFCHRLSNFPIPCLPSLCARHETQLESLKKAASRMPDFAHLKDRQPKPYCYDETKQSINFFMPVVWRSIYRMMPSDICWCRHTLKSTTANQLN